MPPYHPSRKPHDQQGTQAPQDASVQCTRLSLQFLCAVLKFQVLVRGQKQVEVGIAVIVRGLFHVHRTEHQAQLLPYAGYPFGHRRDARVVDPFLLDAAPHIVGIEGRQGVGRQVTIVAQVVQVDAVQGLGITRKRLLVVLLLKVYLAQRAIGAGRLEQVVVVLEQRQGMTGKGQWQAVLLRLPVSVLEAQQVVGIGALLLQERVVGQKHRGKGLQTVGLEVMQRVPAAGDVGTEQVVELLQGDVLCIAPFHQSARTEHVVIINPLHRVDVQTQAGRNGFKFGTGLCVLLLIEVIGRCNDVELGPGIYPQGHVVGRHVAFLFGQ